MKTIILALLAALPFQANALLIHSSDGDYQVSTVAGKFSELESTLVNQVWWGKADLAAEFADLVGDKLGLLNLDLGVLDLHLGAYFVHEKSDVLLSLLDSKKYAVWGLLGGVTQKTSHLLDYGVWAIAEKVLHHDGPVAVPEPGALGLMGLGLMAMAIGRRRRAGWNRL